MQRPLFLLCACTAALVGSAVSAQTRTPTVQPTANAVFHNAQGQQIGTATLTQTPAGVLIDARLTQIEPGSHAFHVHQTGKCEPPDFKSAGEHLSTRDHAHGFLVPKGAHAGDMPNQIAQPDRTMQFQVLNSAISLQQGEARLFDADGSALVLHAKPDDYKSQPSGNAGGPIACAVVKRGAPTQSAQR